MRFTGRVSGVLSTALLAAGLVAAPPADAAPAAPCSGGRVLNVVAHHDDDLLFLTPDLINDLANPDVCVRTLFLVGSYYSRDGVAPHPTDADKYAYMESREVGDRQAYQAAAGIPGDWQHAPYSAAGVQATTWSLGDRVSTVELRVPDAAASNDAGTMYKGQLWALYADNQEAWPIPGADAPVQQRLNREQVLAFVQGVIDDYQPTVINTEDPSADHQKSSMDGNFHADHVAATRLLVGALNRRGGAWPRVTYYRDYLARESAPNLDGATQARKQQIFEAYCPYDDEIYRSGSCQPDYVDWYQRQYYADSPWRGYYLWPMSYGFEDPKLDQRYRVVNRATGLYLDVSGSSTADQAPLVGFTPTGNPNQAFTFKAALGGWNLRPVHSNQCLDVTGSSTTAGTPLIQFHCTAVTINPVDVAQMFSPNQAFRIRGDHTNGYTITNANSGLALTSPAQTGGAVTQAPTAGTPDQLWDLVPA
ncbi:RICIN domain-containing protein [Kitasatospora aureofaciens]|uniref:RICIN domain-containing protein n=1 Tax=Kitasatospora aureofaciens TaxID=1894 RepID=UPI001C43AED9|nr:RICIN domain-containing protein [Kitasatospora aureofaciens]MBV6699498.1 RICIN domain-containing protein [Kitasatospora aureofaciens]